MRSRRLITSLLGALLMCLYLTSCSETSDTWNPYYDWKARNEAWYEQIADSARTAIATARAQYGEAWEQHCDWRMYKTYMKSEEEQGPLADTVCVHILHRGQGTVSPCYSDTVRINFRGWTMATEYETDDGKLEKSQAVFTQTYYGSYDPSTAAPQVMAVSSTVEGYCTALQYMVEGDDWLVYLPCELAYKHESSSTIPAYSTLVFRLCVVGVYEAGSHVPDWK